MAELNDFIKQYDFKCQKCGAELTSDSATETALVYGLIILAGEQDGFIGWSCPACNARVTNLTQVKGDPFLFVGNIHNEIQHGIDSTLMYRSFPFSFSASKKNYVTRNGSLLDHSFQVLTEFDFFPDFEPPHGKYISFKYGSHAMGPAISIYWHDRPQIEKLIDLENKKQIRVFPRYEIYDQLNSKIERLCWDNRIRFDFYRNELGSDVKKLNFNPERDIVQKPYEFLTILDTANSLDYGFYDGGETLSNIVLIGNTSVLGSKNINLSKFDDFGKKTWPLFHSDWMQNLLNSLAEDFITEYLTFVSKINRNNEALLRLIEFYIKKIYAAVTSRYQRKIINKKADINNKKRIIEAEKCFSKVKIISNDNRHKRN